MKNINLGAHFLFLLILCSIKIERLLFLKFLKILAFFDSYFWPFNKSEEKIKVIFVISAIILSIWNVFIKFRWHDEKLTAVPSEVSLTYLFGIHNASPSNHQNRYIYHQSGHNPNSCSPLDGNDTPKMCRNLLRIHFCNWNICQLTFRKDCHL